MTEEARERLVGEISLEDEQRLTDIVCAMLDAGIDHPLYKELESHEARAAYHNLLAKVNLLCYDLSAS